MDPILGTLAYFDEEAGEYVCNVNYRPASYNPYPFDASRPSSLAPTSELAPYAAIQDASASEQRKAASCLDLDGNLRKWPQTREVPSLRKDDGPQAEGSAPALSAAYAPAGWLSEQDWFDGADASTDDVNMTDDFSSSRTPPNDQARKTERTKTEGQKGDRSACPGAESGSLVEGGRSATFAEGSRSVRPGTESAPLEERYEVQENYRGDRSARRGAKSGSPVEGCRSTHPGVESAALAEGSCSGCPGPQSAPLEERKNKGGRRAPSGSQSVTLAEVSCSGPSGTPSARLEERLQEQVFYEGDRRAPSGCQSVFLAGGRCSGPSGTESAPFEGRRNKRGRRASSGCQSATLAGVSCSGPTSAQLAYLEERILVAQRLEVAAESRIMRSMSSLKDVEMIDVLARMRARRSRSSGLAGPRSILKRSRTDETQPEPPAKRVRWCPGTDALPTPTNTRGGKSQRLYSPRPPQRWDQRLVHGVAKLKAALSDVVVKSQSAHVI